MLWGSPPSYQFTPTGTGWYSLRAQYGNGFNQSTAFQFLNAGQSFSRTYAIGNGTATLRIQKQTTGANLVYVDYNFYSLPVTDPGTNSLPVNPIGAPTPTPTPTPPPTPTPTPTPAPTPTPTPVPDSFTFEQYFPPGMAGKTVTIRDAQGNVLGQWVVPAGGTTISSSVTAPDLDGAYWDIDGIVGPIDSPSFNPSTAIENPGYDFNADSSYAGGEFRVQRSDGSIAASGLFGTSSAVGKVTIATGSSATVWTRVPAGDGNGGVWVPTPVNLSGNSTVRYAFVSNPNPSPVPTPTFQTNAPAPAITNAPAPLPGPGTNTIAPGPETPTDVSVDVPALDEIETNDGEQGVLDQVTSMSQKFRGALEKFQGAFENVALTFNEFRKFTLGGVGTNCTLSIGPVNLNLAGIVPEAVRSGMKLFILLVGVFAAIRYTWETFA